MGAGRSAYGCTSGYAPRFTCSTRPLRAGAGRSAYGCSPARPFGTCFVLPGGTCGYAPCPRAKLPNSSPTMTQRGQPPLTSWGLPPLRQTTRGTSQVEQGVVGWRSKTARGPLVPEIRLKDKRIGLRAMRAGLNAKIGCRR